MTIKQVNEESTFRYTAQLQNELGVDIVKTSLEALTLEVYELRSETRLRTARDAFDANDVTIATDGSIVWAGQLEDTRIVNASSRLGSPETHVALFQFAWESLGSDTLTDSISTTSGSNIVTIAATGHGFVDDADEDHVFLTAVDTVGGLNLNGAFKVNSIVNANSFTIVHKCAATATESLGGGSIKYYRNPRVNVHQVKFSVVKMKPGC